MKHKYEKWETLLMALYAEALRGGSFAEVTSASMGFSKSEFGWTLYQLQMRGLIEGCVFQPPNPDSPGSIMGVIRNRLLLTPKGFQKGDEMTADAERTDEKLMIVWRILRDVGCGIMANIVYSWIE